jgi:hypothetical protein
MRDIRGDLQERANVCEEQIRAALAYFEQRAQQLQREMDAKITDLKSGLAVIHKLMEFENGFMGNVVPLEKNGPAPHLSLHDRINAVG